MKFALILSALSALVMGHSLFLAVFFWTAPSKRPLSNRLLALLLLALAVRTCKSIIIVAFPEASDFWPALGLIGMAAIGPFLWLYLQSLLQAKFRLKIQQLLHFSLSAALLVAIFFVEDLGILYAITIYQILGYLIASFLLVTRKEVVLKNTPSWRKWIYSLMGGVSAIWAAFTFQLYFATPLTYIGVTAIAALVLYGLTFWMMRQRKLLEHQFSCTATTTTLEEGLERLGKRIQVALEEEKLFTDPRLTVGRLGKSLNEPTHQVSKALNAYFRKTFPEVLNSYRIEAAKGMLTHQDFQHLSIEAIAYESGFQSLSAFYAAFKKSNQLTPAQYRKQFSMA